MSTRRDVLKYSAALPAFWQSTLSGRESKPRKGRSTPPRYLILACDGGGMRGYLSSLLLQRLQQEFDILGPTNRNVDLYAGTSTGGLIALGLAQGKSIDSVVDLYQQSGSQIFHPLALQLGCVANAVNEINAPVTELANALGVSNSQGFWQVLFDNIGDPSLRTVLQSFIPENPTLSALASKVMVVTFQLDAPQSPPSSWNPLTIDNFDGSPGAETTLYDAALSTSAAPIYFPPYHHPQFGWCSDGGLFANNPAALALGRALQQGQSLANISLLSIGTGLTNGSVTPDASTRLCFGLNHWADLKAAGSTPALPLLNALMDGVSMSTDALCNQLLGGAGRYLRLNPTLPKAVALDDYSPATLAMFEQTAQTFFESEQWTQVEKWVKTNFVR